MQRKDDNGLAWSGTPKEERSGGFVDGVAMNQKAHALAVDPNGVVGEQASTRTEGRSANLDVERLDSSSAEPIQRNGRVRMTSR